MNLKSILVASAAVSALAAGAPAHSETYISLFGGISSFEPSGADLTLGPNTLVGLGYVYYNHSSNTYPSYVPINRTFYSRQNDEHTVMYVTDRNHNEFITALNSNVYFTGTESNLDIGYVIGAALGYKFDMGFRLELELSHRFNSIGGHHRLQGNENNVAHFYFTESFIGSAKFYSTTEVMKSTPTGTTSKAGSAKTTVISTVLQSSISKTTFVQNVTITATRSTADAFVQTSGSVSSFAIMANIWYDFDFGRESPVTPFFGGGIGLANLDVEYGGRLNITTDLDSELSRTQALTSTFNSDTSDSVFAWQLGAGFGVDLGGGMNFTAQYRYFATDDLVLASGNIISVESHAFLAGIQIPFGQ